MRIFENPSNGHREDVDWTAGLWTFLFGLFYLLIRGLWAHCLFCLGFIICSYWAFGEAGTMFVILLWLIYPFVAPNAIAASYLRKGWKEIPVDEQGIPLVKPKEVTPQATDSKLPTSLADEIQKLVSLKEQGQLTQAEFDHLKAKLM